MLRRLPPLNALKAFEAVARSNSVTRAAEELSVTQGAVSQQVKSLEATLGVKLFNRERQRLVITEAGRQYLAVVRDAFDRIAIGTERLVQRQSSGALTVRDRDETTASYWVFCGRDCVVPFAVEVVRLDVDLGHFGIGDLNGLWVIVVIEAALDGEAAAGGGGADQLDNHRVGEQRFAAPVLRDEGEEAMFDPV